MKKTIPLTTLALFTALSAAAAPLVSEDFDYTTGTTVNADSLNGGTGFTGAWATNNMPGNGTGTVSANELGSGTGNSLFIQPTSGTTTAFRQLSGTLDTLRGASTTLWLSYDVELSTVGTRFAGLQMNSGYSSPGSGGTERLFFGKGSAGGSFNGLNWDLTLAGSNPTDSGIAVVQDQAAKLLMKFDFDADSLSGWVLTPDSTVANEGALGTADMSHTSVNMTNMGAINAFRLGSGFTSGSNTTSAGYYDTLRLGTGLSDVVAIPEPSTLMLLGLAGLSAVVTLRRRKV